MEYPPLRYTQFYKIGDDGDIGEFASAGDRDICVTKYHGRVYMLHYGMGAFSDNRRADKWPTAQSGNPKITEHTYIGPTFFNSSVVQFANSLLVYRDIMVRYGIGEDMLEKKPRTLSRMLKSRLRKIDEAAVYHPDSFWDSILGQVADGYV